MVVSTQTVPVSGLTCHGCVDTVTEQLTAAAGVESISIDLVEGGISNITITAAKELSDDEIQTALSGGGAFVLAR
jgi:copper chaperone